MSTSQRTINQVRSILGRLDRSIDEARDRRLNGRTEDAEATDAGREPAASTEPVDNAPPALPSPEAPPPVGPARATPKPPSPFGRAKPLRKSGTDDGPEPRWNR